MSDPTAPTGPTAAPAGADPPASPPGGDPAASAPGGEERSAGAGIPRWAIGVVVGVVALAVAAAAFVLVRGDDDGGGGQSGGDPPTGALPAAVDTATASTPVIRLFTASQWDLDGQQFTTTFGNTCSYVGAGSFSSCTLRGGDPATRTDLVGADVLFGSELASTSVATTLGGDDLAGCPGRARLGDPAGPVPDGPALCVRTDAGRVFAIYATGIDPDALHLIAAEVVP